MLIRVSIIAPAIAVRAGLRALLSDDPQINVIAEAANLPEMADAWSEADVMVWAPSSSLDLAAMGYEFNKMKIRETTALLLVHNDPKVMESLTRLPVRAWGLLDPEATQTELIASIQALNEGLSVTNPNWLNQMVKSPTTIKDGINDLVEALTGREVEILQLLALGLTNKQIAVRLRISAHTVKFHVSTIFSKLGTTNRVETVNLGLKKGLIIL
jgi:NarL family two-component system response regulator YdfI